MPERKIPKLTHHKASGRAVVRLNGKDHYCGEYGTDEAKQEYDRKIAEWLSRGRRPEPVQRPAGQVQGVSIGEVIVRFWRHAESYYRHADGTPTSELGDYRLSLRPLAHLYGSTPAGGFGPLMLKSVRELMIVGYDHPKHGTQPPLSRKVINQRIGRIKRVFKWAVAEELVEGKVYADLQAVEGLHRGRCQAKERAPIQPVAESVVLATLPHVLPPVRAMIQVQLLTGARPGEVCQMRACDIDMTGNVWLYRPGQHKTLHRGKDRIIAIGPKAQAIIRPFLQTKLQAFLFSPHQAVEEQRNRMRALRKSKVQPSQVSRAKPDAKRVPGERYTGQAYQNAIERACIKAKVPPWCPLQLRHTRATEIRREYGLEAAQVALGHARADVTQVYAERDLSLATKLAEEIG